MTAPIALPLGPRMIVRFTGPDAQRYLNGQVTQDIAPLAHSHNSTPACVTDAKGRLGALVRIISDGPQTWYVEAPPQADTALFDRLTRYLIADDAEATDVSDLWHIIHCTEELPSDLPNPALARSSDRFGLPGHDIWLPATETDAMARILALSNLACGDLLETRRIETGIPVWGADAIQDLFPAELGLDRTAVSFTKGCYIGQEVISRMKYAGKINRRLSRLSLDPSIPASSLSSAHLSVPGEDVGGTAGTLTSIAPLLSQDGRRAALAMIARPWLDAAGFDIITPDGIRHSSAARVIGPA